MLGSLGAAGQTRRLQDVTMRGTVAFWHEAFFAFGRAG